MFSPVQTKVTKLVRKSFYGHVFHIGLKQAIILKLLTHFSYQKKRRNISQSYWKTTEFENRFFISLLS